MNSSDLLFAKAFGRQNQAYQSNPDVLIDLVDYDGSGNILYVGYAAQGSASSSAKWRVAKLAYDGSNRYTGSTISPPDQVWDNRASLTYT